MISFPQSHEFAPFYEGYVNQTQPGEDVLTPLHTQSSKLNTLFSALNDKGDYRYAPGKWSVKELLGHITDTERIFSYRLLRIARGDKTPLQGFDQDIYIEPGHFESRSMENLIAEFEAVRKATIILVESLDQTAIEQTGTASHVSVSARALIYIIVGHVAHHLRILEERYVG